MKIIYTVWHIEFKLDRAIWNKLNCKYANVQTNYEIYEAVSLRSWLSACLSRKCLPSVGPLLCSQEPKKFLYVLLAFHVPPTPNLLLFYFIVLIILGEEWKLWKFGSVQISASTYRCLCLRSKYLPQHRLLYPARNVVVGVSQWYKRNGKTNVLHFWNFSLSGKNYRIFIMHAMMNLKATVTSRFPDGTAWPTAKRFKVFPIRVKYRSIETIKSTYLYCISFCRQPEVTVTFNLISGRSVYAYVSLLKSLEVTVFAVALLLCLTLPFFHFSVCHCILDK